MGIFLSEASFRDSDLFPVQTVNFLGYDLMLVETKVEGKYRILAVCYIRAGDSRFYLPESAVGADICFLFEAPFLSVTTVNKESLWGSILM